ncbi:MAG: hypothetical protein Greene07147_419 [Parcubacteria group bacterium Greene0714_7]|nr:MAG: hypothetical protein Greene07147_419 [Parcubacteria group bacterium Greene0714_7]
MPPHPTKVGPLWGVYGMLIKNQTTGMTHSSEKHGGKEGEENFLESVSYYPRSYGGFGGGFVSKPQISAKVRGTRTPAVYC